MTPRKTQAKPLVEITWPRGKGEIEIWGDLCLARCLLSGRAQVHAVAQDDAIKERILFGQSKKPSDAGISNTGPGARRAPSVVVEFDPDSDFDLCQVGTTMRRPCGWTSEFRRFLECVIADRQSQLEKLKQRPLIQTTQRLAARLDLTPTDAEFLCVLALVRSDTALNSVVSVMRGYRARRGLRLIGELSILTGLSYGRVAALLGPDSSLRHLRLIKPREFGFDNCDETPLGALLDALTDHEGKGRDPLAHFLQPAQPSTLALSDFAHLPVGTSVLLAQLHAAQASKRLGVNVLLHGAPGHGKTQLARLLAQELSAPAFEVPLVDSDDDARDGTSRVESLVLCQKALSRHERALMIFDEAEDLFPTPQFAWFFQSKEGPRKGWINRMLEANPVPTIWIANQVGHVDPAFLRRFDLVIEVPPPPRVVRRRLLDQGLSAGTISERWRSELVELDDLSPPEIERISRTNEYLPTTDDSATRERVLRQVFEQARKASGRKHTTAIQPLPGHYRPEYVNADVDLVAITRQLALVRSGRLCLFGAPGSGKSAFAQYLAETLEMPLLLRRASDLIDKYVGESEKNLARAFEQAGEEGAVLLIDEADSFLQDRQRAQRSWEVSAVNELLTQMERFEGVLVMCTNLFEQLDPAALRRFDLKIRFQSLRPDQRIALLDGCVKTHAIPGNPGQLTAARERLDRLDRLTPGDFQTVLRRRRLVASGDVLSFVDALAQEQAHKRGGEGRAIGFVH